MKFSMEKLILFLSLLAWGWFNQQWLASLLLLLIYVGSLLTAWRWEIKPQQFHRIGDLVTVLILLTVVYFAFFQSGQKTVFIILKWLPLFFAPVLLAQLLSSQGILPLGTLFYSVRKRQQDQQMDLDFILPYASITLLSASAANDKTSSYFIFSVLIVLLILWTARPKKESIAVWSMVIIFSVFAGFYGQQKLFNLQTILEDKAVDWLTNWHTDPFKSSTSIGDIGDLKLSDRIEFRVKATEPLLLQQSSYDRYLGQTWYASQRRFKNIDLSAQKVDLAAKQIEIFQQLKPESIIPIPAGIFAIKGLEGANLQQTAMGTVKLMEAPEFVNYQVFYTGKQLGKHTPFDLELPEQHQNWISLTKEELKLENQIKINIALRIKQHFQTKYFYSLFLANSSNVDQALQHFMLDRKAGHCEYFAVATVFLLRSYGIPARLANGYSMQEYDKAADLYLVRRRHAHAWAIAYIDDHWQAVDSTPAQWLDIEEDHADPLQVIYDWFSALQFGYKQWRYQQAISNNEEQNSLLWGIAMLLVCYLIWRLYSARRQLVRKKSEDKLDNLQASFHGQDSELYLIEQALSGTDSARLPNESIAKWAKRINNKEIMRFIYLHYCYRFDPNGITEQQRTKLKQDVERWMLGR